MYFQMYFCAHLLALNVRPRSREYKTYTSKKTVPRDAFDKLVFFFKQSPLEIQVGDRQECAKKFTPSLT